MNCLLLAIVDQFNIKSSNKRPELIDTNCFIVVKIEIAACC